MPHDVVWLANQLFPAEAADICKNIIAVFDVSSQVRGRNQFLRCRKTPLVLRYWQILSHLGELRPLLERGWI
jgi:hypothetical protein